MLLARQCGQCRGGAMRQEVKDGFHLAGGGVPEARRLAPAPTICVHKSVSRLLVCSAENPEVQWRKRLLQVHLRELATL